MKSAPPAPYPGVTSRSAARRSGTARIAWRRLAARIAAGVSGAYHARSYRWMNILPSHCALRVSGACRAYRVLRCA